MAINHKGKQVQLPFLVQQATSVYLYSLLDYEAACSLCEKENYTPIILNTPEGEKKAAGLVCAVDYRQTSLVPYREWVLGIFVTPKDKKTPEVAYVNETSLFFQNILDDDRIGCSVFSPKMILSESLPTEIGFEYYGIPKEVGEVSYNYATQITEFSASTHNGPWIMKASLPKTGGVLANFGLLWSMFKAYTMGQVFRTMQITEFSSILVGSAEILAKMARITSKKDPKTAMFPWNNQNCQMEINPESHWGKILLDLKFQPELVCYVPNLTFEFSEPLDQK